MYGKHRYISVGDSEIFYTFVESQGNPREDPVILYLTGGPGCSGFHSFFYQSGPLQFTTYIADGVPGLSLYPYAWTKMASIIYIDAPVGAGFSYVRNSGKLTVSDSKAGYEIHMFARKWFSEHPEFSKNSFYILGDSYAGMYAPLTASHIVNGNRAGLLPQINLAGVVGGSPFTDEFLHANDKVEMSHRLGLISDEVYESATKNCNGDYVHVDYSSNRPCFEDVKAVNESIADINVENVVLPNCWFLTSKSNLKEARRFLQQKPTNILPPHNSILDPDFCADTILLHELAQMWANNEKVQDALHVRKGKVKEWMRCNITYITDVYKYDIESVVDYHRNLTKEGLRVLIYGGDHETLVSYYSTLQWIRSLDLTLESAWRPWSVDGQTAGYTLKYKNSEYRLTYATLKGGGHSPTETNRKDCYEMFERWIHSRPL